MYSDLETLKLGYTVTTRLAKIWPKLDTDFGTNTRIR